jgi:BirA family biotin operon repressor/biotin-[acetyl-CoA-carboxylase] ligase
MAAKLGQPALNEWARNAQLPWRISCYDSLPSTNYVVKNAIANDEPEGFVAAALEQRSGYGRQGRAWVSPLGGVYFSVLLRPQVAPRRLASIGPALSFAVRQALAGLAARPNDVLIKWPNDVVCAQGKLCGMSCEYEQQAACIGIGINILHPAVAAEIGGKHTPAYLVDLIGGLDSSNGERASIGSSVVAPPSIPPSGSEPLEAFVRDASLTESQLALVQRVMERTLDSLYHGYRQWLAEGFPSIRSAYRQHAALLGEYVKAVTITDQVIAEGTVEGVDPSGCLLLRNAAGKVVPVASGEIHLR